MNFLVYSNGKFLDTAWIYLSVQILSYYETYSDDEVQCSIHKFGAMIELFLNFLPIYLWKTSSI